MKLNQNKLPKQQTHSPLLEMPNQSNIKAAQHPHMNAPATPPLPCKPRNVELTRHLCANKLISSCDARKVSVLQLRAYFPAAKLGEPNNDKTKRVHLSLPSEARPTERTQSRNEHTVTKKRGGGGGADKKPKSKTKNKKKNTNG